MVTGDGGGGEEGSRQELTHLHLHLGEVHIESFVNERAAARSCVQAAKKQFHCDRIDSICSSRQLFSVSSELLGQSRSASLPSDVPHSRLPQRFCDFFSNKISNLRDDLDSRSCEPPTFALCIMAPCFLILIRSRRRRSVN